MNMSSSKILSLIFCLAFVPATFAADNAPAEKIRIDQNNLAKLSLADQDRVLCIAERLETITTMDRSELTRVERKALRVETRELKREADMFNGNGTVIYISSATIIIILLVIILLT